MLLPDNDLTSYTLVVQRGGVWRQEAWNCSNFSFMIVDQSNDFLLTLQIKNFFLGKCSSYWLASLKPIILLQSVFLDFSQGIETLNAADKSNFQQ